MAGVKRWKELLDDGSHEGIRFSQDRGVEMTVDEAEWDKLNKEYIFVKDLSNEEVLEKIRDIIKKNDISIQDGKGYSYKLPSRVTNHVKYVESIKQLCLSRNDGTVYSFGDPKTADKALVITAALSIVQDALLDKVPIDCRSLLYRDLALFGDQETSDDSLYDICCLLGCSRHSLNVTASPKGLFMGPITLKMNDILGDYDIACQMKSIEGTMVPIAPSKIVDIVFTGKEDKPVKFILVVEKKTVFHYLVRRKFHFNYDCIIVTGGGQPDTSTRSLVSRLCAKFKGIPAFACVDPDPHGILIFATYKFGSKNISFDNFGMASDKLEWIGFCPYDLKTKFPQSLLPLSVVDKRVLNMLRKTNYLVDDKAELRRAMTEMFDFNFKYETEVLHEMGSGALYDWVVAAVQRALDGRGCSSKGIGGSCSSG